MMKTMFGRAAGWGALMPGAASALRACGSEASEAPRILSASRRLRRRFTRAKIAGRTYLCLRFLSPTPMASSNKERVPVRIVDYDEIARTVAERIREIVQERRAAGSP